MRLFDRLFLKVERANLPLSHVLKENGRDFNFCFKLMT